MARDYRADFQAFVDQRMPSGDYVLPVLAADSPHVFAGRLVALLEDAAQDNPGPWSDEWADHVLNHAWQQYLRLCEVAPIREQVKA